LTKSLEEGPVTKLQENHVMAIDEMERRGTSKRSLAQVFGVDESTVRYRLKRLRSKAEDGRKKQPEACREFDEEITAWIRMQEEAVEQGNRPEAVMALYDRLVSEHGYTGSYKSVLRYVRRRSRRPKKRPIRRIEVQPGMQAQVDWVQVPVWVEEHGGMVKLWAFVMVLSASRKWAVIWSRRKDMAAWIRCHNEAFSRLGGIPVSVRPDNEKTAAGRGAGPWGEINAGYQSYAEQMGFLVNLARPRKATDKGKVERRARDVKWLQIRQDDRFLDLEDLQRTTDARIKERSQSLICPQTGLSIEESWRLEELQLRPLPPSLPRPFDVQVKRTVGRDCLVNFEGRQYSVPFIHVGREAVIRGAGDRVEILIDDRLVKDYPRGTKALLLIDQDDYEGPGTPDVMPPTPLGHLGRSMVLRHSWEAPKRPIDTYAAMIEGLA
jgi:transposase